jgi:hypothetical protein
MIIQYHKTNPFASRYYNLVFTHFMTLIQVMIQRRRTRVKDKFRSAPPKNKERKQKVLSPT